MTAFKASRHWVYKFTCCAVLSVPRQMPISQKLPNIYEEQVTVLQHRLSNLQCLKTLLRGQIGNTNQTPVYMGEYRLERLATRRCG